MNETLTDEAVDVPEQDTSDVIRSIGLMPPGTILTKKALAVIFKRDPFSVDRAVSRKELPKPAELFGCSRWTAGAILRHIDRRIRQATRDANRVADSTPRPRGVK